MTSGTMSCLQLSSRPDTPVFLTDCPWLSLNSFLRSFFPRGQVLDGIHGNGSASGLTEATGLPLEHPSDDPR